MKDYRLSEIRAYCKTTIGGCNNCNVQNECHLLSAQQPHGWDIEPRDMIELPYKEPSLVPGIEYFDVFYRDTNGKVARTTYACEAEADTFIAES